MKNIRELIVDNFAGGGGATKTPNFWRATNETLKSTFHESQRFILEVGGHKFFAER